MSSAGLYNTPIRIIKTKYEQDETGSMVKKDDCVICTRARIMHNGGGRGNENGDIAYLYNKQFQIHRYVQCIGYDEVEYQGRRYRILEIEDNEDYQYKMITTEEIND